MSSIFISYSSKDAATATQLRELLVARGYPTVFLDRSEEAGIVGGTKWATELFAALDRSDIILFLASPASLASPWCHTELAMGVAQGKFLAQISLDKQPTHPLLVDRQRIPPDPKLEVLVDRVDAALTRAGLPTRDPFEWDADKSPYPGLERLDEDHAAVLFGRDAETSACIQRLAGPHPLPLLVAGPSGSGKSSLVRAGVLPRLRLQAGTTVLKTVEPGNAPLQRIAIAFSEADAGTDAGDRLTPDRLIGDPKGFAFAVDRLVAHGDGGRVVLFLDQAEDLVERASKDEVADVVRRLEAVDADRLVVISAVRSVSLDDWLREPALGSLARTDPVWVRPMDRTALREVITGPAHVAGIRFEPPELVDRILDDTEGGNALPLLAALLEELTAKHTRLAPAVVTTAEYEAVGPVAKVIERRAEAAAKEIAARHQVPESAVVDAYLRLVQVDEQTRVTAAEVPLDDVPPEAREILSDLEGQRLVTRDQRVVAGAASEADGKDATAGASGRSTEVVSAVHEAVFRAWPAVALAIKEQRTDLETRTWLGHDARTWDQSGKGTPPLAGGRLTIANDWAQRHPDETTPEMHAYLAAANGVVRRRRALTVAVPILAAVAIVVGALAFLALREADRANQEAGRANDEASRANQEADRANAARAEADAIRLVSDARLAFPTRPDLGYLLAMEAAARSDDPRIQAAPQIGLAAGPGPRRYEDVGRTLDGARLDRSGSRAILAGPDSLLLWDVDTESLVATRPRNGDAVAISGDGSRVAFADGGRVVVEAWGSDAPIATCEVTGAPSGIELIGLSANGTAMVVSWRDAPDQEVPSAAVVAVPGCTRTSLDGVTGQVRGLDIDAAGTRVAIAQQGAGPPAVLWDVASGLPFPAPTGELTAVRFADDGRVVGLDPNGLLELWQPDDTSVEPVELRVNDSLVAAGESVALSTSGELIVAASSDGQVRGVRVGNATPLDVPLKALPPTDYTGKLGALDVATTRTRTVTVDRSGRIVVWDLDGHAPLGPRIPEAGAAEHVAAMSDGAVLTSSPTGAAILGPDGRALATLPRDPGAANSGIAAVGASGQRWAVALQSGEVLAASTIAARPATIGSLPAGSDADPAGPPTDLVALPDDRWAALNRIGILIAGGSSPTVEIAPPWHPTKAATDGRRLFVGDMDGAIHVLDLADPLAARPPLAAHDADIGSMAVSPDGTTLATGSDDRSIALWTIGADGSLTERARLRGNEERVISVAFSPDGHWLASSSEDSIVRLYDLDGTVQIGDPIPSDGRVQIAFAPDADRQLYLARFGLDHWDMRVESWPALACDVIGSRRLVPAEEQAFLNGSEPTAVCP